MKLSVLIERIVYRMISCEDCGKVFNNLEIRDKYIVEEYVTENIKTYLRRSKLKRLLRKNDVKL